MSVDGKDGACDIPDKTMIFLEIPYVLRDAAYEERDAASIVLTIHVDGFTRNDITVDCKDGACDIPVLCCAQDDNF